MRDCAGLPHLTIPRARQLDEMDVSKSISKHKSEHRSDEPSHHHAEDSQARIMHYSRGVCEIISPSLHDAMNKHRYVRVMKSFVVPASWDFMVDAPYVPTGRMPPFESGCAHGTEWLMTSPGPDGVHWNASEQQATGTTGEVRGTVTDTHPHFQG
jgi:hypothetical protein